MVNKDKTFENYFIPFFWKSVIKHMETKILLKKYSINNTHIETELR